MIINHHLWLDLYTVVLDYRWCLGTMFWTPNDGTHIHSFGRPRVRIWYHNMSLYPGHVWDSKTITGPQANPHPDRLQAED